MKIQKIAIVSLLIVLLAAAGWAGASHTVFGKVTGNMLATSNIDVTYNIYMTQTPSEVHAEPAKYHQDNKNYWLHDASVNGGLGSYSYDIGNFQTAWVNGDQAVIFYEYEQNIGSEDHIGYQGVTNKQQNVGDSAGARFFTTATLNIIPSPNVATSGNAISVSWNMPVETVGSPSTTNVVGYYLYRAQMPSGVRSKTSHFEILTTNMLTTRNYLDSTITHNETYYYAIKLAYRRIDGAASGITGNLYSANSDYALIIGDDSTAPTTSEYSPAVNEANVPTRTPVMFRVSDFPSGVSINAVSINFNGLTFTQGGGSPYTYDEVTGDYGTGVMTVNYFITVPTQDLDYTTTYNVTINAMDVSGNLMTPFTYSFSTISTPSICIIAETGIEYPYLQFALNAAQADQHIYVYQGEYIDTDSENMNLIWPNVNNITLMASPNITGSVVLNAQGVTRHIVVNNDVSLTLQDLILINGKAVTEDQGAGQPTDEELDIAAGGSIYLNNRNTVSLTINTCEISGNMAWGGGAIAASINASINIIDSVIENNAATGVGGAILMGSNTIKNSILRNNQATGSGAIAYGGNNTYINTLIYNNTGATGILTEGQHNLVNSTIVKNTGSIFYLEASALNQYRGINAYNTLFIGDFDGGSTNNFNLVTANYSAMTDTEVPTSMNISNAITAFNTSNFVDYANNNFKLNVQYNVAVNAGSNALWTANSQGVTTDVSGNTRTFDTYIDLGAYEVQVTDTFAPTYSIASIPAFATINSQTTTITVNFSENISGNPSVKLAYPNGTSTQNITGNWIDDLTWKITNYALPADIDYGVVTISVLTAPDMAGNAVSQNVEQQVTFNIDSKRPTATVAIAETIVSRNLLIGGITVNFSEAVNTASVTLLMDSIGGQVLTINSEQGIWTSSQSWVTYNVRYTLTSDTQETVNVSLINVADLYNNAMTATSNLDSFTYEGLVPTISSVSKSFGSSVVTLSYSTVTLTLNYSESMATNVPSIGFVYGTETYTVTNNTWMSSTALKVVHTPSTNYNGNVTVNVNGATDVIGNPLSPNAAVAVFTVDTIKPLVSSITLNNGIYYVTSINMVVDLAVSDASQMKIAGDITNNGTVTNDVFRSYASQVNVALTNGDATKTLLLTFMDINGNQTTASRSIILSTGKNPTINVALDKTLSSVGAIAVTLTATRELSGDIGTANQVYIQLADMSTRSITVTSGGPTVAVGTITVTAGMANGVATIMSTTYTDLNSNTNNILAGTTTFNIDTIAPIATMSHDWTSTTIAKSTGTLIVTVNTNETLDLTGSYITFDKSGTTLTASMTLAAANIYTGSIAVTSGFGEFVGTINSVLKDVIGNTTSNGAAVSITVNIDTQAPNPPTLTAIGSTTTNIYERQISVNSSEAVKYIEVYESATLIATLTVNNVTEARVTVTMTTGTGNKVLKAKVTDIAGNQSELSTAALTFIVAEKIFDSVPGTATSGITINVSMPAGAVSMDVDLRVTISAEVTTFNASNPTLDPVSGEAITDLILLKGFEIDLVPTGQDSGFTGTVTINSYIEIAMDISPNLTSTSDIRVYYHDSGTNSWSNSGITIVSVAVDRVVFRVTHLTYFAIAQIVQDATAPSVISLKLNGESIVTNDMVSAQPTVNIIATDNKGVKSYRIQVYNGSTDALVAGNDTGTVNTTVATSVTINAPVNAQLTDGTYYVKVTLADEAGNIVTAQTTTFRVIGVSAFAFNDVIAAPNPFNPNTGIAHIGYQLNKEATVRLYIHSLNGDLMYSTSKVSGIGYDEITWNGRDEWGENVANGGYLAYMIAKSGSTERKVLLKIAVLR
ncbi:choice-of-anchor Q domain-containing protein [Candidatus Margulisiibacteriota bacterium]